MMGKEVVVAKFEAVGRNFWKFLMLFSPLRNKFSLICPTIFHSANHSAVIPLFLFNGFRTMII
jgi:hypothetical protein